MRHNGYRTQRQKNKKINEQKQEYAQIQRPGPNLSPDNIWTKTTQSKIFINQQIQEHTPEHTPEHDPEHTPEHDPEHAPEHDPEQAPVQRPGPNLSPDNIWTKTTQSKIFVPVSIPVPVPVPEPKSVQIITVQKTREEEHEEYLANIPSCSICFDKFTPLKQSIKMCSNQKCTSRICYICAKEQYDLPINHRGPIDRMKVLCGSCNSLIDPLILTNTFQFIVSESVRELFRSHIYRDENEMMIARNTAQMLYKGHNIWRCDSEQCHDDKYNGIFQVERIACAIAQNDNVKKFCQECIEVQLIKAKQELREWGQRGYDTSTDIPLRMCPGCKQGCERIPGSCPNMKCRCGAHYCYCCGVQFDTADDVYAHLNREYKTYFPMNEQILKYLDRKEKIKYWRKNIDPDITDDEIEQIMDAQYTELLKQNNINQYDMILFNDLRKSLPPDITDDEILIMMALENNNNIDDQNSYAFRDPESDNRVYEEMMWNVDDHLNHMGQMNENE